MSSRAMKKLLRDSQGPAPLKDQEHPPNDTRHRPANNEDHEDQGFEDDDDEDDYTPSRPAARNLFALLDEDDQEDDVESDDDSKEPAIVAPVVSSSSKKKKNKKKNSAAAAANPFDALKDNSGNADVSASPTIGDDVNETSSPISKSKNKNKKKKKGKAVIKSVEEMSVEEFERSLQQMNKQLGSVSSAEGSSQKSTATPLKQLLAVDTRFLDADAEMKKMFGARVVNSEIKDRRYAKITKRALLAQPRNTWPIRKASGLSMEIVETDEKEHVTTFKIVHSEYYQRTQLKFLGAVASYDPGNLVALLRENPFHVDSLLQLSEVSKHNGDNALAGEFIEQALYAFEKSFHSLFNLASGAVRLSFMEVENRSFFLALHRHIQFLGRRGCWRTAFEFNKLLLSLDPTNDELGALLSIDFYALKAQEYTYLRKLYERMETDHGLDSMPNFLYSIALAQFHMETAQGDRQHEESSRMLQKAVLMFPTAVPLLADQGSFSVDAEIAGAAAFYPTTDLPKVLDLYIHLFVLRNFALWKEPEVVSWLKSNVRTCVQSRFNNTSDSDLKDAKALLATVTQAATALESKNSALSYSADGTLLESDAYEATSQSSDPRTGAVSLRVCRHVLVSDFNALARYLPQEIVSATMHMHDPLPPRGSRNVYEERFEAQRGLGGLMGGARDAAQSVLEEVVRRFRAVGLPGLGGGEGEGADGGNGLQEEQLRQITDALQMLRARDAAAGVPGAFPGQQATAAGAGQLAVDRQDGVAAAVDGEAVAGVDPQADATVFQRLAEMMRLLEFTGQGGVGHGGEDEGDESEDDEDEGDESEDDEDDEDDEDYQDDDDDYEDEDQPFGHDGDDGWEPYDPAAYE